jgi:hypothetical protein
MSDAIMYILRDYIPRTSAKIWQEISDRELCKPCKLSAAEGASCGACCSELFAAGDLSRIPAGDTHKYYIPAKPTKMTRAEFIDHLREQKIETESDYHDRFDRNYSGDFPVDPCSAYSGFEWKCLTDVDRFYSLDECIARVTQLEPVFFYEYSGITDLEKNKTLHTLDRRIPKDISAHYAKKLNLINNRIFEELI